MELLQDIIPNKYSSLWYGGDIAEFQYKDATILIVANGEVRATLLDDDGNVLEHVVDKNDDGKFNETIGKFLHNDDALYNAIEVGKLILDNNNWFEVYAKHEGNVVFYSVEYIDDYDNIVGFIKEVENNLSDFYSWLKAV